jgi:hypothetical protein
LDGPAFSAAEYQRTTLIEHIGNCERILMSPLPRAFSIEIRRSIVLFLLTLTFALLSKDLGWVILPLLLLVAYAVLSVDLIGSALQNPFAPYNLGALPLDEICRSIEGDLLALLVEERGQVHDLEEIPDRMPHAVDDPLSGRPPTGPTPASPPGVEAVAPDEVAGIAGARRGEEGSSSVFDASSRSRERTRPGDRGVVDSGSRTVEAEAFGYAKLVDPRGKSVDHDGVPQEFLIDPRESTGEPRG